MEGGKEDRTLQVVCHRAADETGRLELEAGKESKHNLPNPLTGLISTSPGKDGPGCWQLRKQV